MKIAIIGSGISGLTAGYLLNRNHDISIFEANNYIGGHTHTHQIQKLQTLRSNPCETLSYQYSPTLIFYCYRILFIRDYPLRRISLHKGFDPL